MPALFERALGDAWPTLEGHIRRRYGIVASDEQVAVARGTMTDVGGGLLATPMLWLGTVDDFLFPESGSDVPFTMRSIPFVDANGHDGLLLERDFETEPPRTFVDTLRWNPRRSCLTDLLGRRGFVAADLHLAVDDGALVLRLGRQWLRAGDRYLPIPRPLAATGTLRDAFDTTTERFEVAASIESLAGDVFGYRGHFQSTLAEADSATASPPLAGTPLPGGGSEPP
jgi:hypothetical protein